MKSTFLTLCSLLIGTLAFSQQELQIHHVNIEDGDATMIGIYDNSTHHYTAKVLIDGGKSAPAKYLLPYLSKIADTHFNYVILTHYHDDHYNGLAALGTGQMTVDSLVDPGGYDFSHYFPGQPALVQMAGNHPAALPIANAWLTMLDKAKTNHAIKAHSQAMVAFGSGLGHKLIIGKLGNFPVTLECVAGWGNTLSANGTVADPLPTKNNANNFSLAFVLRCGEFRYFIGGDLGGTNTGLYIDQEDPLIGYLAKDLNGGHSCGYKADHHGSNNANEAAFLKAFSPSVVVTSAGSEPSWHLPETGYLAKLAAIKPKGVYFTNLYDFGAANTNSLTTAQNLFANHPGVSFDYGNPAGHKYSYMIRVKPDKLATESDLEVDRVDITQAQPYTMLTTMLCHKK